MGKRHKTKCGSAQRDSIMSNGRLSGVLCWPHGRKTKSETTPAQLDSGMSNLGILRSLGILGWKTVKQGARMGTENHKNRMRPAQRGSKNSKLDFPLCLAGYQASPALRDVSVFKVAQRDSGMSILGMAEQGIMTVLVKNILGYFMGGWDYEKQNVCAQRYSKMSILKIETENSLPQRHSRMSNEWLTVFYAGRMGRRESLLCK